MPCPYSHFLLTICSPQWIIALTCDFFPALYGFWSFLHHTLEFARWGEIAAINIVNIVAMCIVILIIYRLFKQLFDSEKIGFIAALIALIGTSFSLWALTSKDRSSSIITCSSGTSSSRP
jgi:hypothetical protein